MESLENELSKILKIFFLTSWLNNKWNQIFRIIIGVTIFLKFYNCCMIWQGGPAPWPPLNPRLEELENELWSRWSDGKLRHSSFSNPSLASPTSQLILQPFFCFSYVTGFSPTSPGEPPMICCISMRKFLRGIRSVSFWDCSSFKLQLTKWLMHGSRHFTNLTLWRNNDKKQNRCVQNM